MQTDSRPVLPALAVALLALAVSFPAQAGITGVCPDGSMFIVKHERDIPCDAAKQVDPNEMPPIKPQYMPRPYGWEKFQRQNDPNNPYNLVTDVRDRPKDPEPPTPAVSSPPPQPQAQPQRRASVTPPQPAPFVATGPVLSLSEGEIRDLSLIVEVSQEIAPATLRRSTGGEDHLVLRFAHSPAFEARLRDAWAQQGASVAGPVLLFSAEASQAGEFWANLTFVQGHVAFHPNREDSSQLGVLRGRLGLLNPGKSVLGYAVLPPRIDLTAPLDIYWNDHQLTARLRR